MTEQELRALFKDQLETGAKKLYYILHEEGKTDVKYQEIENIMAINDDILGYTFDGYYTNSPKFVK